MGGLGICSGAGAERTKIGFDIGNSGLDVFELRFGFGHPHGEIVESRGRGRWHGLAVAVIDCTCPGEEL